MERQEKGRRSPASVGLGKECRASVSRQETGGIEVMTMPEAEGPGNDDGRRDSGYNPPLKGAVWGSLWRRHERNSRFEDAWPLGVSMSDPQLGGEGRPEQRHSSPILFCNSCKRNGRHGCPVSSPRLSSVASLGVPSPVKSRQS